MTSWPWAQLGEVVCRPSTWNPATNSPDGSFVYVDLSAVNQETKEIVGARHMAGKDAPSRARQLVAAGDVLVSTVRPNLNSVARVHPELDGVTASTGFCVLRPRDGLLDPDYLFHWVRTSQFVASMTERASGASYPAVSDGIVLDSSIPLPPLEEQRRIAALLDRADSLRAKRRAAVAHLDTLTQSIFLEMFGDPVTNPKGWERVPFGQLLADIESGQSPICLDRPAVADEWGVLKLGAVTRCEYNSAANKGLPAGIAPNPALEVQPGDLLFTRKNTHELVGACALVGETPPRLLLPDLMFRFRLRADAGIASPYLHQLLIYPTKRRVIQALAGGSAGSMPNISKERLRTASVERPPLALQAEFARRVIRIKALNASLQASLCCLDTLFASLQHRAFRGEL